MAEDETPKPVEIDEAWFREWFQYGWANELMPFMDVHAAFDAYCARRDKQKKENDAE